MPGSFLNGHNPLTDEISLFLLQVFIIVATSRLLAIPLKLLRQPVVISEVIGGILLGPSAIGKIPGFSDTIFPKSSLPSLKLISQFGLIFYLYLVGMELDASKMKSQFKLAAAISLAGIALPFLTGIGIAKILYDTLADQTKVSFSTFLIFCGVAMSITAFPVLARILSERQLMPTDVGQTTLAAAAVDDAIAWVLLGLVVALIKNPDSAITALYVFLATLAYAIFLWVLIRPLFVRMVKWGHEEEYYENTTVVITLLMVIVSGL
jgi:Kef-type K+ transport system membrane component KefB